MDDRAFMAEAFEEAKRAGQRGECPVGAVVVCEGKVIAKAGNRELELCDPTAHAEILAIRAAGRVLGKRTLEGCTVYTTLWPCPMCDAAILQAHIPRVVSGARTFKWVADVRFDPGNLKRDGPIMEPECREIFARWCKTVGRVEILDYEGPGN